MPSSSSSFRWPPAAFQHGHGSTEGTTDLGRVRAWALPQTCCLVLHMVTAICSLCCFRGLQKRWGCASPEGVSQDVCFGRVQMGVFYPSICHWELVARRWIWIILDDNQERYCCCFSTEPLLSDSGSSPANGLGVPKEEEKLWNSGLLFLWRDSELGSTLFSSPLNSVQEAVLGEISVYDFQSEILRRWSGLQCLSACSSQQSAMGCCWLPSLASC